MNHIQIDQLRIRVKGIAPSTVETAVRGLNTALARRLSAGEDAMIRGSADSRKSVDAGHVLLTGDSTVGDLREAISGRIAAVLEIRSRSSKPQSPAP